MAITPAQRQDLIRTLGYTGTFGAGGADAWLAANPQRTAAYNSQVDARNSGYNGAFGGGQYDAWKLSQANQAATPSYGPGGVQTVGVVEPLNATQKSGLTQLAGPYTSPYQAPAYSNYQAASTAAQAAVPNTTTNNNISSTAYTGANGTLNQAGQLITQGATPLSSTDFASGVSQYMNPFTQNVINSTNSQLNQQADIARNKLMAKSPGSLSFGDTANGVAQGALNKDLLTATGNADSALNYQGFNDAVSNINNNQNRLITGGNALTGNAGGQTSLGGSAGSTALNNISNLASLSGVGNAGAAAGQQFNTTNATNTIAAGTAIQDQNQKLLDATQSALAGQSGYSNAQLAQLAELLKSIPGSSTSVTPSQSTNQGTNIGSTLGSLASNAGTIASLASFFV